MTLNPLIDFDFSIPDFDERVKELKPQGFRLLSLSLYGPPADPRVAAVWDKRAGPDWHFVSPMPATNLGIVSTIQAQALHFPAFVAGTGGGAAARLCAVFEKLAVADARELTVGQSLDKFAEEVGNRGNGGWIIKNAAIYDDADDEPRVAAVWARNKTNVAWTATAGLDSAQMQQHFDAQFAGWGRMDFRTASTNNRFLAVFRDDLLGPNNSGFIARNNLTLAKFLETQKEMLGKGFYTACFQGFGPDSARRFGAIFVKTETPVARKLTITGGPAVTAIDDAVTKLMQSSNIRGATLAIVKGTKLVLARGYTWAEPDYPVVEPTTSFRLGSVSKLTAALGVHQLVAEGPTKLGDTVATVLPLTPAPERSIINETYLKGTVSQLMEKSDERMPRYQAKDLEIIDAFGTKLPVKQSQIASFMVTLADEKNKNADGSKQISLDDTAFFLAGQLIKAKRGTGPDKSMMLALASRITVPLQITRIHSARSRLADQPAGEGRHHPRSLALGVSVMEESRPLVRAGYGGENLDMMDASGGLSAAAVDYARLLAAMNAAPYTPLGRPAVDQLLKSANASPGHGFDQLSKDAAGIYRGDKGGLLETTQAGINYTSGNDGLSYIVIWNGVHTGKTWQIDKTFESKWYPRFHAVLDAPEAQTLATDLFQDYDMEPFPDTQTGWHWCKKCQGLAFAGRGVTASKCPAGGAHSKTGSANYALMHSSSLPYGQADWRRCKKCQGLHFGGSTPSKCPAGGTHEKGSLNYSLVHNSPYKEHQTNWRWCKKCQALFFNGGAASVCPGGGAHDPSGSGDYSLAGT